MKISYDIDIRNFVFWSGAKHFANRLTDDEWERISDYVEEEPWEWTETQVNDWFWFDDESILENILGLSEAERQIYWNRPERDNDATYKDTDGKDTDWNGFIEKNYLGDRAEKLFEISKRRDMF